MRKIPCWGVVLFFVLVFFILLWYNGMICHEIYKVGCNSCSESEAVFSYNIINTLSGILTPLFSAIALIVAFKTFIEDRNNNKKASFLQKKEQFINEFFNMLQTQSVLSSKMRGLFLYRLSKGALVEGDNYFRIARKELNFIYKLFDQGTAGSVNLDHDIMTFYKISKDDIVKYKNFSKEEKIKKIYNTFLNCHPELNNYFRHLYHILKKLNIEGEKWTNEGKESESDVKIEIKEYSDILKATLTEYELVFVNYNCFCFKEAKELVCYFGFLKNLREEILLDKSHYLSNF